MAWTTTATGRRTRICVWVVPMARLWARFVKGGGVCLTGIVECGSEDGIVLCSTSPGGSVYVDFGEVCNGLDDNCDGQVDEVFFFAEGNELLALGADCGLGNCAGGTVQCSANQLELECSSTAEMAVEQCNGQDDNCDGVVDNGLDPNDSQCWTLGVCAEDGVLVPTCSDGAWECQAGELGGLYEPGQEQSCDGLDNDCDGLIDESFYYSLNADIKALPVGSSCGHGTCLGGTVVCADDGKSAICNSLEKAEVEICDGKDNDCDGSIDEAQVWKGLALGSECKGTGECGQGIVICHSNNGGAVCSTNPDGPKSQVSPELCNGLDDDCDGFVDNNVVTEPWSCWAPGVCSGGAGIPGECLKGVTLCDFSEIPDYQPGQESSCDKKDNDCDGLVDEFVAKQPGSGWTKLASGTPPLRYEMIAAANPVSQSDSVVLYGGRSTGPDYVDQPTPHAHGDTWRYLGNGTWDELNTSGPGIRTGATLVTDFVGKRLLLFGGLTAGGSASDEVWQLDTDWNWLKLAPTGELPGYVDHAAVMVPETQWMWIVGGTNTGGGKAVTALSFADPDNPKWISGLPDGPGWRAGLAATYVPANDDSSQGHIVVFGGQLPDGTLSAQTWVLDLAELGWIPVFGAGPPPRRDHRMALMDGKVYLFGGVGSDGATLGPLWRFDIQKLEWSQVDLLDGPSPRRLAALIPRSDGLLLLGGSDGETIHQDAWLFASDTQTWTELESAAYPSPRLDAFMDVMSDGSSLLLYGGWAPDGDGESYFNDRWQFNSSKGGGWSYLGNDGPLQRKAAVAYDAKGGRLMVHGGQAMGSALASAGLWIYQDGAWNEIKTTSSQKLPLLHEHGAAWDMLDDRLFLFGGQVQGVKSIKLWVVSDDSQLEEFETVAGVIDTQLLNESNVTTSPALVHHAEGNQLILASRLGLEIFTLNLATKTWTQVALANPDLTISTQIFLEPHGARLLAGTGTKPSVGMSWINLATHSASVFPVSTAPNSFWGTAGVYLPKGGKAYVFGGQSFLNKPRNTFWSLSFDCIPSN
ncbi:MAG TPA: hypothetical protein EYN66_18910 [Myxococcales bacterium]|nr:hypothetical protein [Myxococcales bacterium]